MTRPLLLVITPRFSKVSIDLMDPSSFLAQSRTSAKYSCICCSFITDKSIGLDGGHLNKKTQAQLPTTISID